MKDAAQFFQNVSAELVHDVNSSSMELSLLEHFDIASVAID